MVSSGRHSGNKLIKITCNILNTRSVYVWCKGHGYEKLYSYKLSKKGFMGVNYDFFMVTLCVYSVIFFISGTISVT